MGKDDLRQVSWGYWYGHNLETGHQTWAVIPQEVVVYNEQVEEPDSFWTEKRLRKIKR